MVLYDARYASWGTRTYGLHPVPVYRRSVWELQLVIGGAEPAFGLGEADRGAAFVAEPSGTADRAASRFAHNAPGDIAHLWLFRPASLHGWGAPDHRDSEVAVFHYDTVPAELDTLVGSALWTCLAWHSGGQPTLDRLADRLCAEARLLAPVSSPRRIVSRRLRASSLLLDATATYLDFCTPSRRDDALDPEHLVERAIAWFEANMHSGVGVGDLASALAVSPSTLNRSFRRALHRSASDVLRERRMSRAAWFLRHGHLPIGEVAEVCGYRDQSAFARAAHRYFGMSPFALRRTASRVGGESNA